METLILAIAILVLPIVIVFGFSGCVGEDPRIAELEKEKKEVEDKLKDEKDKVGKAIEQDKKDEEAKLAKKYENVVKAEPNLVSHWRLSEGEGNAVALDSAPDDPRPGEYKNLPGIQRTVQGALALVADTNDKAAQFDGVQGYVEVPYHLMLNPPLDFSVEAWINPTGTTADPQIVVGSYDIDAAKVVRGYVIEVEMSPAPLVRARIGFGSDATAIEASLGDGTEHGGWRHIVITYDNVAKQLKLYVNSDDGAPDKEMGGTTGPPVFFVSNSSKPLRIAAGVGGAGGAASQFFKGRIDEVALYRAALDGLRVRAHFLAGTSLPP